MNLVEMHLRSGIGLELPRHWYHVGHVVHAAAELQLFRPQRTLLLGNDLTGAHEIVGLHELDHAAQRDVIESCCHAVPPQARLIAELPGPRDEHGASPFWQGLGRHFCPTTPDDAERRHGAAWQGHVAALLPRQLVYASFLPEAALAAIGNCAAAAGELRELLIELGFAWHGHVGIGDAGPVLEWIAPARAATAGCDAHRCGAPRQATAL